MPTVFYDCRVKTAHLLSSSLSRIKNVFDDLKRTKKLNRSTLTSSPTSHSCRGPRVSPVRHKRLQSRVHVCCVAIATVLWILNDPEARLPSSLAVVWLGT